MILNVNKHIQKTSDQGFFSKTNVTLKVPDLSFAESVFDMDHPACRADRRPLVLLGKYQFR